MSVAGRTFDRPFPGWIRVVAIVLAVTAAIGTRAMRRPLEGVLGRTVASKVTLFAFGNAFLAYKLTDLVVLAWACRRWGRCTISAQPADGSPNLTFESPLSASHGRRAVVRFEDVVERAVTPHGIQVIASRVTVLGKDGLRDLGRVARAMETLLIPCAPGAETDEVLAVLDAPWAPGA